MAWQRPTEEQIREALRAAAPHLANLPIEFLAEGWEFWAFTAGDYVLRFPRETVNLHRLPETATNIDSLRLERRLLPELGPKLSVQVPAIDIFAERGPNGVLSPATGCCPASRCYSPPDGQVSASASNWAVCCTGWRCFPVETALQVGVPLVTGPEMLEQRARL